MGGATEVGDMTYSDGKSNTGYYIGKDDKIVFSLDIVNYTNNTREVVSVTEVEYIPGKPAGVMDATQQMISPTMCDGDNSGTVKGKHQAKFTLESKEMVFLSDGILITPSEYMTIAPDTLLIQPIEGHLHGNKMSFSSTIKANGR
jgi:hypothetical protein